MAGASLMFFGFLGFESISMTVDEIKEPQKNVPRGIVLALIIVASLYAVVSLVLTGVVHYTKLNVDDAVAYAREHGYTHLLTLDQDSYFLYKAGVAAIFGPGTPVAKAACQILEILMDEE